MNRSYHKRRVAFPLTLLATAAVAMLPWSWQAGWSREVAGLVKFPLRPFTHVGNSFAGWLQPARPSVDGVPREARELVAELREDRDIALRLYQAEHRLVLDLEEQNRQLQLIPADNRRHASRVLTAFVTGRSPGAPLGMVELKPERGGPMEIPLGTIAVYGGVHLLGRTVGAQSGGACPLLPVANRATRPVHALIWPRDHPELDLVRAVSIHLEPTGRGAFTGEVEKTVVLDKGDIVRLDDPAWPRTAQMMVLGEIDAITVNDREPLRHTITVEPLYAVTDVASMTLIVETFEDARTVAREPGS